jgi:hypothetical protein
MNASCEVRQGYLYVKAAGLFNPRDARRVFFEWYEIAHRHSLTRAVCDVTLVEGIDDELALTLTQFRTAQFIAQSLPPGFKLVVLQTNKQLARDQFVENVLRNEGACAKVTSSLEEALVWLGLAAQEDPDVPLAHLD